MKQDFCFDDQYTVLHNICMIYMRTNCGEWKRVRIIFCALAGNTGGDRWRNWN